MLYTILKNICKVISLLIFRVKAIDVDNFNNTEGKLVLCSNHISMLDPILIATVCKRKISYMGKKELFGVPILKNILHGVGVFPVDRQAGGLGAIRVAISTLKEGKVLGIFPEGTRVEKMDLDSVKSGVSLIANMGKSDIIPVYIKCNFKLFSKLHIVFGQPKNYFEGIEGKVTSEMHSEISKQILIDIYELEAKIKS